MGLDACTESGTDVWNGAYSAFTRWRNAIAEAAGYTFTQCDPPYSYLQQATLDWDAITPANLQGDWDETPADPLLVLIAHSDCDGHILPDQAGPLADRLAELLPKLPTEPDSGHIGYWQATTQKFIDGLRAAAASGEKVEFA